MQLVGPARVRMAIVWVAVLGLVLGVVAAPVGATNGHPGNDVDRARADALEVVNHELSLLEECREAAQSDQVWAIYTEGIEELEAINERIPGEEDVEEIWALKHRALDIYGETKERALAADEQANEDSEHGDHEAKQGRDEEAEKPREQEEQQRRDEAAKKQREQEQAAALAEARADTRALIDKKYALMNAASLASHHHQMAKIYREAAEQLDDLRPQATDATTIAALDVIRDRVWEIVHDAKKRIAAVRPGHAEEDDAGNDQSGEAVDDDGAGDDQQNDGTGDDQQSDPVEEATILATLNALELEVDMYQIEVTLAIDDDTQYGYPEGPTALAAGDDLLEAIDAARLLTGDDLVLAYLEVNDRYNAYMQLLVVFDLTWDAGIFNGQVAPI